MPVVDPTTSVSTPVRPDYQGGGIVNLMSSIAAAHGHRSLYYPVLTTFPPERFDYFKSVVLVVIDGLGYKYLSGHCGGSLLHEHLEGAITSVFPPTTAAAVPTFLTANPVQQHGLTGWFTYLREFDAVVAVLPFVERGSKQPLPPGDLGPRQLTRQLPLFECIDTLCHTVMPADIAYSTFNRAFSRGATIHSYYSLRQMFDTVHKLVAKDVRSQYIHAYWPEFDRLAHAYGVTSRQVRRHYTEIDREFTRFKRHINGTDTMVIITADHGFVDADPDRMILVEKHPALTESSLMPLSGEPRLAYCYVRDEKREQFESYVQDELNSYVDIYLSEDLITNHYFGMGPCHPRLSERVGHYVLVAKDRVTVRDRVDGEGPIRDIGVHGGVSADEMYVPLIVLTG